MLDIGNLTYRIVGDDELTEARKTAEHWLAGADEWPDESVWKPEFEMVTGIARKLPVNELAYLIAYLRITDEDSAESAYRQMRRDTEYDDADSLPF